MVAALAALAIACGSGTPKTAADRVRIPDAEGVVGQVNFERLSLDGDRVFRINQDVESFTSRGHAVTPLVRWQGRYVHLGLNKQREVVWVAGIGVVIKSGAAPSVIYTGVFDHATGGRAYFEDGTVLKLDQGLSGPRKGAETIVTIDPSRRVVTKLTAAA